jgi:opacity protein-like surface antigen
VGATSSEFNVMPHYSAMALPFDFLGEYDMNGTSPAGLLGLEYLYQFNERFVLGVEVSAGYTKTESTHNPVFDEFLHFGGATGEIFLSDKIEATLTNDFALLLKPGIVSHRNTLFYALIGPRWAHIDVSSQGQMELFFPPTDTTASGSDEISGYELGFTVGGGIQQRLTPQLHLNLEYAYTDYGNINSPFTSTEITVDGMPTDQFAIDAPDLKITTNTLLLGLSYQW